MQRRQVLADSYLRCSHCRGFYESSMGQCRYCGKDVPMKDSAGHAKRFPDRATCRALQIAEFEQLPPDAHEDPMRPDPELLDQLCYCLHCGPAGGHFEAVEMRWMPNEHMWACPCTTCGGRGFEFDIHLVAQLWQCAQCFHRYSPPNGDARASNANCPKCGCKIANGWFQDEPLTEEEEAELEKEYKEMEAKRKEEERLGLRKPLEEWKPSELPLAQENDENEEDDAGAEPDSLMSMMENHPDGELPDDIDFPRDLPKREPGELPGEDDIPW